LTSKYNEDSALYSGQSDVDWFSSSNLFQLWEKLLSCGKFGIREGYFSSVTLCLNEYFTELTEGNTVKIVNKSFNIGANQ
jgi:hypothetical protein